MPHRRLSTRRSLRLKSFDYSRPGAYFITICAQNRHCLFGSIRDGAISPSPAGAMAESLWAAMPSHYAGDALDAFVVMPNHIHGILILESTATLSLPDAVQRYKSLTTARYRHGVRDQGWPPFPERLWQRNYYEHIIRDSDDMARLRDYITTNPARWSADRFYPALSDRGM